MSKTNKILTLYRADKRGNKTTPEHYNTDGIISKQINGGDPEAHKKYGWLKTITSHIHASTSEEKFIYETTQYLSFTTDRAKAAQYLKTWKQLNFVPTDRVNAEGFLFTANIPEDQLETIGKGVFLYRFKCNYDKLISDPKFQNLRLANFVKCKVCNAIEGYTHGLLIIDAKVYLSDMSEDFPEAYSNAKIDNEWLLMPVDPMIDQYPIGYASRIPPADFWTVDFFKYLTPSAAITSTTL